jgi:hypothetical protein
MKEGTETMYKDCEKADSSFGKGLAGLAHPRDQQLKIHHQLAAAEERMRNSLSNKLNKIAELFEADVLSEEDALKACQTAIGQHARVNVCSGVNESGDGRIKS